MASLGSLTFLRVEGLHIARGPVTVPLDNPAQVPANLVLPNVGRQYPLVFTDFFTNLATTKATLLALRGTSVSGVNDQAGTAATIWVHDIEIRARAAISGGVSGHEITAIVTAEDWA